MAARNRWIRTGDAGTLDEHGFLFFEGRLDDMIMSFVKTRLAAHARPRRLEFVESLPATSSGKTSRAEIRRRLLMAKR